MKPDTMVLILYIFVMLGTMAAGFYAGMNYAQEIDIKHSIEQGQAYESNLLKMENMIAVCRDKYHQETAINNTLHTILVIEKEEQND